jgi:Fur family peroxide stress response transcriptional regulator
MYTSRSPEWVLKKLKTFEDTCHKRNMKVTHQRLAVYRALVTSDEHPSVEQVYQKVKKEMPTISLDTVNRTLNTLVNIGAACVVAGLEDIRRFDGDVDDHMHFQCIKCKRIIDFHDDRIENMSYSASLGEHFTILRKTVYLEGVCDQCARTQSN